MNLIHLKGHLLKPNCDLSRAGISGYIDMARIGKDMVSQYVYNRL